MFLKIKPARGGEQPLVEASSPAHAENHARTVSTGTTTHAQGVGCRGKAGLSGLQNSFSGSGRAGTFSHERENEYFCGRGGARADGEHRHEHARMGLGASARAGQGRGQRRRAQSLVKAASSWCCFKILIKIKCTH